MKIEQSQMRQQLGLIHRVQCLFALDLDRHLALDHEVRAKTTIQLHGFVYERHRLLTLHAES